MRTELLTAVSGIRANSSLVDGDAGMTTAEYAIGTLAAVAFATVLYTIVTGDSVTAALTSLIDRALQGSF